MIHKTTFFKDDRCINSYMRLLRATALEAVLLSRFDAKHVCDNIKGVLSCPLWLQIYVSIVNNSPVIWYISCYEVTITDDVLLIFPRIFDRLKCYILQSLCKKAALHDLIKIHDQFVWSQDDVRSNHNHAFRLACQRGHLDVAKWLHTVFQLTDDDARSCANNAFISACAYGHLDTAQWLYTTFQLTVEDVISCNRQAFVYAHFNHHPYVCDWLVATFGESVGVCGIAAPL